MSSNTNLFGNIKEIKKTFHLAKDETTTLSGVGEIRSKALLEAEKQNYWKSYKVMCAGPCEINRNIY